METKSVVVIGGGAMGASVAWHLRGLGVEDVVLLERDSLAAGSTGRSAGGIRAQFSDELNIRIALRSLEEFERMDGIDFRRHGYLFLLDREEDVADFRKALALQQRLGVRRASSRSKRRSHSCPSSTRTGCSLLPTADSTATRRPSRSCSGMRATSTCARAAR